MSKNKCVLIVWLVHAHNALVLFAKVSIAITVAHSQGYGFEQIPNPRYEILCI